MALKNLLDDLRNNNPIKHLSRSKNKMKTKTNTQKDIKLRKRPNNCPETLHQCSSIDTFYAQTHQWMPVISIQCPIYTIPEAFTPLTPYLEPFVSPSLSTSSLEHSESNATEPNEDEDPIESYLLLPKEVFPPARVLKLDPNPIIDEFCKLKNVEFHTPWILDLELGIPKSPITRLIPIYNAKLNCINCKNTPDAIHPGFESCEQDFKTIFLFYYDCVVSTWYRGYVLVNSDRSVDNFQSWLLLPMQDLGMCWP